MIISKKNWQNKPPVFKGEYDWDHVSAIGRDQESGPNLRVTCLWKWMCTVYMRVFVDEGGALGPPSEKFSVPLHSGGEGGQRGSGNDMNGRSD